VAALGEEGANAMGAVDRLVLAIADLDPGSHRIRVKEAEGASTGPVLDLAGLWADVMRASEALRGASPGTGDA
jgi:hypothetical protein